jgi:hypothetical protein
MAYWGDEYFYDSSEEDEEEDDEDRPLNEFLAITAHFSGKKPEEIRALIPDHLILSLRAPSERVCS